MGEEVKNGSSHSESAQMRKKYVYTWRNKWITDGAGSIDDFIEIYERLAVKMRRWKEEGIIIDPDIIGSYGDDYTQFCVYDERVALKEGFEEDYSEEEEDDWDGEVPDSYTLEFQVNEHLTVKLFNDLIMIYVDGERFDQCHYLLIVDPLKREDHDTINSIDEAKSLYNSELEEKIKPEDLGITKEQEFWAHCSNLHAWAENNYDTRLLHSNLSFPLLKKLTEVGDVKARTVFKEEIAQRFVSGYIPVMRYLFQEKYVDYLTQEEFEVVLNEFDYDSLDLSMLLMNIWDYRASKYGTSFLLRVKDWYSDFFADNHHYVEVASHHLDKSEFSPIAITPTGGYFIRGSNDGKLKEFEIFGGELMRVFGDHKGEGVTTLAISSDGKLVASASNKVVYVWDYRTGVLLQCLKGHQDHVNVLVFDPNGDYLVSGSSGYEANECAINVWDLQTGELKLSLGSHWKSISSLSFSPNGNYLASGGFDKTINVWDTKTGKLITTLVGHKNSIVDVAITNDKRVISASYDDTIKIWDFSQNKTIGTFDFRSENNVNTRMGIVCFLLTPDQELIITGLQRSLEEGGILSSSRLSDGEALQYLPIKQDFPGHYEELNNLAVSKDGVFILSASRERMVKVWMEFTQYLEFQVIMEDL
ncbi:MAG: WD40 repeat domain-containing protein [Promethearchaeota archaeon]